ncbi:hypothetical protein BAOM_1946 [Peribacillus asahii]|uniref:Uncharacterized protein n=1 Tax=Peribacillus asahii TaxID=228899 RepID=A0A3T0KQL9_9BACI|nr:hypothetical protein BAOM_1946 [Peribacillus asahii]
MRLIVTKITYRGHNFNQNNLFHKRAKTYKNGLTDSDEGEEMYN